MIKSSYNIVGVMSGTSLDGIDLAHISFDFDSKWTFKIHSAETIPYTDLWQQTLSNLVSLDKKAITKIDDDYTTYLAQTIHSFILKHQLKNLDAICSHGHTALHQPEEHLTYQIGNQPKLAKLTNTKIVCDFRTQDVLLGGQGAPLVPIGDQLLFSEYDYCINLGGFANVSSEKNNQRIAYDICPVNIIMNHYTRQLGFDYDEGGQIAKSGRLNNDLLTVLNAIDFYAASPPKSLGVEWVEKQISPLLETSKLSVKDILRTCVEHIAIQITNNIKSNSKVLFTGGGTYNTFLLERIKAHKNFELIVPSKSIIEFKEALIFGLLGVLKLRGEINCLSSVTGARNDHSSGEIYYP
ncbi:anhydro-N-acetylmuramic acid kinase [Psychroserpens algicola]|uniref:anhydro-N-acetylmuramic acid kinase n=1 Tax=Psychroserpens algicola TaxID=1719034 RepID=UPI001953C2B4|nr:anhydro-N-acetylmuramic acid kinase [Psychroserpens algicola]